MYIMGGKKREVLSKPLSNMYYNYTDKDKIMKWHGITYVHTYVRRRKKFKIFYIYLSYVLVAER